MSKVCISIVTFNNKKEEIEKCLDSLVELEQNKALKAEIFVLDNSAEKKTSESIESLIKEKNWKSVTLIKSKINSGFAGGHNQVLRQNKEKFDYFWLFNPDAFTKDKDILIKLVKRSKELDDLAILQPTIYNFDESVGNTGNVAHFLGTGGQTALKIKKDSPPTQIGVTSGAAMFFSQKVLDKVGFLEDMYFAYHEDTEYCFRARLVGIESYLCPNANIFHDHEFSKSEYKFFLIDRNKTYKNLTYYDIFSLVFLLPPILVLELTTLAFFLTKGYYKTKLKVYKDIWKNKNKIAKKRQEIGKIKTLSSFRDLINKTSGSISTKDFGNILIKTAITIINIFMECYLLIYKFLLNTIYYIAKIFKKN